MTKKKRYRRGKRKSLLSVLFKYLTYSFFAGILTVFCVVLYFANGMPDLNNLQTAIRNPSVIVQTYDGEIVASYGDMYEDVVEVKDLPKYVPEAFMAVEDKRFLYHFGVDFIGFFRALYKNFISGKVVEGGSTITQQLAKNILIGESIVTHYDKSIARKVKELLLAVWLEHKFTKSEIMMMYLNRVYFGAGTYGIDAASRKYFNKQARYLSIYESAILAGLLKAPSKYSPSSHSKNSKERARIVLEAMQEQKFIKNADEIENKESGTAFSTENKIESNRLYFGDFVYEQAKKILGDIEDDITVVTTLDLDKQKAAEEAVNFYFDSESERYKFSEAAFICIDRNGGVLSMVGGRNYTSSQFNRVTQAFRMPGSAFKIFVYGAAIEYGYQVDDKISDAPVKIAGWKPKNYKWKEQGEMSVLEGFTYSVNTVCIRLALQIGIKRVAQFANKLGISNVSLNDMSVSIGTTPVTLKDLTCAYATFMDGLPIWSFAITEIRTKDGKVLYKRGQEKRHRIIDQEVLENCRILLREVIRRGTGRAANVDEKIYGKTGSNGDDDAWFIGFYDPKNNSNGVNDTGFAVGTWIGNDNNKSKMTHDSTGGRIPARIAARFFKNVIYLNKNNGNNVENSKKTKNAMDSVLDRL